MTSCNPNKNNFWGRGVAGLGVGVLLFGLVWILINPYLQQFAQKYLLDGELLNNKSLKVISSIPLEISIIGGIILSIAALRIFFLKYENYFTGYYKKLAENEQVSKLVSISDYLLTAIIYSLVFALYYKGLTYFFIRDDLLILYTVKKITTWQELKIHFINKHLYRPLVWVYFLITYRLFGLNPIGYHLVNISTHALNGILLYFVMRKITRNKLLSFLAGFIFITRYSHFYDVLWIAVVDTRMTLFSLLTILFYLKSTEKKFFLHFSIASYIVAICLKEFPVVIPPLLFLYDWGLSHNFSLQIKEVANIIKKQLGHWIILLTYFVIRLVQIEDFMVKKSSSMYHMRVDKIALNNLLNYLRFSFDGPFDPVLCLIIIFIAYGIYCLKRGESLFHEDSSISYKKLVGFGTVWFFLSIFPVLFLRTISTYWLYLAQLGFSITFGCIFYYFVFTAKRYHPASGNLLVMAFCILGFINASGNISYKMTEETHTLWETATIGENFLRDIKNVYPNLAKGSTIYFTPKNNREREWHFRNITYKSLFQLFYDDDSLKTLYLEDEKKDQFKITDNKTYVFAFDRYHLYDLTPSFLNKQK
jgi:hypothetical protein